MHRESTAGYDLLYDIIRRRSSIRKVKPDPIPDEYINKILEAGRWAMSGANSQPVGKTLSSKTRRSRRISSAVYTGSQRRILSIGWSSSVSLNCATRAYQMTAGEGGRRSSARGAGWSESAGADVVVGDGRRQWGTVQGGPYVRARPIAPDRWPGEYLQRSCISLPFHSASAPSGSRSTSRSRSKKFSACRI